MTPKQHRYLEATKEARGVNRASVTPAVGVVPAPVVAPLTMPGGAVQSGGYMGTVKYKTPSMAIRKVTK